MLYFILNGILINAALQKISRRSRIGSVWGLYIPLDLPCRLLEALKTCKHLSVHEIGYTL